MAGAMIGVLCGIAEFLLFPRMVDSLSSGNSARVLLYMLIKLLVLAAAFVPVIIFFRSEILYCGIGLSVVLVGGSFIRFIIKSDTQKKQKEGGNK